MRNDLGQFAPGHANQLKHGKRRSRIYSIWRNMRTRCENANCDFYPDYGGRGIKICEAWLSFENFYADMGDPPEGMTLDRIDNDRGYFPGNCRWATKQEQSKNRRNARHVTAFGKTRLIAEWAEQTGTGESTIRARLNKGWDAERAVGTPARKMDQGFRSDPETRAQQRKDAA